MDKYRIKEYQGKFIVEQKQNPTFWQCIGLVKYQKWKELYIKSLHGLPKKYTHDTLEEAKERVDKLIKRELDVKKIIKELQKVKPKYHYYPEETK